MVETFVSQAAHGDAASADATKGELLAWCRHELLPHATAEEKVLYPAAHAKAEGRLLVDGMLGEHKVITELVDALEQTTDVVRAAATATGLRVAFDNHLTKENELLVPLLVSDPDVSVAGLLEGMHELIGGHGHSEHRTADDRPAESTHAAGHAHAGHDHTAHPTSGGHSCACAEAEGPDDPELDTRVIPHAIRHAAIFGALDALGPGRGMVLVASHDPIPLLAQLEKRSPDTFTVDYLTRGPNVWRLRFVRTTG